MSSRPPPTSHCGDPLQHELAFPEFYTLLNDIEASHQVSLYGALQQAYEDLRQSQPTVMQQERLRALGQMASGIAHDINNAISPVALYTEHGARDYLATIQRHRGHGGNRRAHAGILSRARATTASRARLSQPRGRASHRSHARPLARSQERGIVIRMQAELAPDLPVIMGAAGEIRDALTNLIFNAVDAMPDGGTLTLRTRAVPRIGILNAPFADTENYC